MKILGYIIVIALLFTAIFHYSEYMEKETYRKGKRILEAEGYEGVTYKSSFFSTCCSEEDEFEAKFTAYKNGEKISGCFCGGIFKGVTIRYE